MTISIIREQAEELLLASNEEGRLRTMQSALYFQCRVLESKPDEKKLIDAIIPVLDGRQASVYIFHDGDIVIAWKGKQKAMVDDMRSRIYELLGSGSPDKILNTYYDLETGADDIRTLCKHKMVTLEQMRKAEEKKAEETFSVTQEQSEQFRNQLYSRAYRSQPEIMIVEDQEFSRNLLLSLLNRAYKTHVAADAKSGWKLYLEQAPDIVFLDIELPGASGHDLAKAICGMEPKPFIIMVTAHDSITDVTRARENGAKGFIVKPYSRQKIMDGIHLFIRQKKSA